MRLPLNRVEYVQEDGVIEARLRNTHFGLDAWAEEIEGDEGFSGKPYDDHLGKPTIGYGCLLPITEFEARMLLRHRLGEAITALIRHEPYRSLFVDLDAARQGVIANMTYQLGVSGVRKFARMWDALGDGDYARAADEMLDSRWARGQTPARAARLAQRMREG